MKLENKVVIVTGGSSGLGAACVAAFQKKGARAVVIWDRQPPAGIEEGPLFQKVDVTSESDVAKALAHVVASHGGVHVLVNCAGVAWARRTLSASGPHPLEEYERVLRINTLGTFNTSRLVAQAMASQAPDEGGERGVLLHTASVAAFEGQVGQVAYAASKGAVVSMTLVMARDLGRFGIRCAAIAPGIFRSPMTDALPEASRNSLARQPAFPQRFGEAEEFAHCAVSMAENGYLNGTTIRLDGGMRMAAL